MTLGEVALWREIKSKKLGFRFSRQIAIDKYSVDFYCKGLQLAIEVDGSVHVEVGHQGKNALRQNCLESLGVRFIRFSDLDVKNNLNWVLEEFRNDVNRF